jgi:3D (Asp-Asp-Asp) domain-containing protein
MHLHRWFEYKSKPFTTEDTGGTEENPRIDIWIDRQDASD